MTTFQSSPRTTRADRLEDFESLALADAYSEFRTIKLSYNSEMARAKALLAEGDDEKAHLVRSAAVSQIEPYSSGFLIQPEELEQALRGFADVYVERAMNAALATDANGQTKNLLCAVDEILRMSNDNSDMRFISSALLGAFPHPSNCPPHNLIVSEYCEMMSERLLLDPVQDLRLEALVGARAALMAERYDEGTISDAFVGRMVEILDECGARYPDQLATLETELWKVLCVSERHYFETLNLEPPLAYFGEQFNLESLNEAIAGRPKLVINSLNERSDFPLFCSFLGPRQIDLLFGKLLASDDLNSADYQLATVKAMGKLHEWNLIHGVYGLTVSIGFVILDPLQSYDKKIQLIRILGAQIANPDLSNYCDSIFQECNPKKFDRIGYKVVSKEASITETLMFPVHGLVSSLFRTLVTLDDITALAPATFASELEDTLAELTQLFQKNRFASLSGRHLGYLKQDVINFDSIFERSIKSSIVAGSGAALLRKQQKWMNFQLLCDSVGVSWHKE